MHEVTFINDLSEFLEYNQIVSLLQDQMVYIGSPKTNSEIINTITLAFKTESSKLMVLSEHGHIIGFAFINVAIGMESAGKYAWLNEMHIHRSYRSKGYGAILLDELKKWCKNNDIKRIIGLADESEKRTIEFYKKNGAEIYPQQVLSIKID